MSYTCPLAPYISSDSVQLPCHLETSAAGTGPRTGSEGHHSCWADQRSRAGSLLESLPALPGPPLKLTSLSSLSPCPPSKMVPLLSLDPACCVFPLAHTTVHVSLPFPSLFSCQHYRHQQDRTPCCPAPCCTPGPRACPTQDGPEELR